MSKFITLALVIAVLASVIFFPFPASAVPGDAKDLHEGHWTEQHRWIAFGEDGKPIIWRILEIGETMVLFESKVDTGVQEVHDFLKNCGNYYIATMDGDLLRVRPFSSLGIFEGKLYILHFSLMKLCPLLSSYSEFAKDANAFA
jgi:hypothetical protein